MPTGKGTFKMKNKISNSKISSKIKLLRDHNHHLNSRRDFLSHGLIAFSAVTTPYGLLARSLKKIAEDCGGTQDNTMIPFQVFDMAGGAALPGNFLVGKQGGPEDLLASYDLLGWDPREAGALDSTMGIPLSAKYSRFLAGLLSTTTEATRANFRMGSICHFAQDDVSSNQLNAATLVLKAGLRGSYITNGLGISDSVSGGNSRSVYESAALKPVFVKTLSDLFKSTSYGGNALGQVGLANLKVLAEAGVELSRLQKSYYLDQNGGSEIENLTQCSYEKSLSFVSGVQGLDPRTNTLAQQVYGISQNTPVEDMNAVAASLSMNTLLGNSGPSTWTLGGCDYHTGSQAEGDRKDFEMGAQIGRSLQLAFSLQKPFVFQLITDGGCGAQNKTRNWVSDSGDKCMTVIGYYHPQKVPKMIRTQVGHYTDGQGADRTTLVGSSPVMVGYAVLANYLNLCGKLGEFSALAPDVFADSGELESVLLFEGA